ncbi:protein TANC1-like [Papaver somniferum]|uniref:protein TANC1-like n=1 Tax=Papaver somniferum TaxID=3469 RepID=UPI000E6FE1AB|nr:protein TANC1-like [Papaver somniferum]
MVTLKKMCCDILVSTPRHLQFAIWKRKLNLSRVVYLARSIMHDAVRVILGWKNSASELIKQKLVFTGSEKCKVFATRQSFGGDSSSPHFELFPAAYTGKLNRFKRLALDHAKGEGIAVEKSIAKAVDECGQGSLHIAAEGGSLNVCKYLLETLKLDVNSKDKSGITPLYTAILNGHLDTFRYLFENGVNADASDDMNFTPLHCAAVKGDTNIITLLLSRGVHIDVATRAGTALHYAVVEGHQNAVKVLLDHGANPNVVSSQGRPLISAILRKSWECVELLLQAGDDPNAVLYGQTPLALAAAAVDGRADGIRRLLEAGADPNYKVNSGATALEIAALNCNYPIVGVLFPVTSRLPTYPEWNITGLMRHVNSDANRMQREVYMKEKFDQAKSIGRYAFQAEQYLLAEYFFDEALILFPKDPAVLCNLSACYARLGDGTNALDYATKCMIERPEWPKVYYRLGVALNIQKRYDDAADAFHKSLMLDSRNRELKDAYKKAVENIKVEEDNA